MIFKCPNCGGQVVYDVETDMMKCIKCNKIYDRSTFDNYAGDHGQNSDSQPPLSSLHFSRNESDVQAGKADKNATRKSAYKLKGVATQPPQNEKNGKNDKPDFNPEYGAESTWVQGMADTQAELKIGHRNVSSARRYMEMNVYHCNNCGADLMVGSTQASTFCSYCGSPSIVYDRISQEEQPDKIIPFELTQEQALEAVRDTFTKGHYVPHSIKALTVESMHGIYIPYWLFTTYARKKSTVEVGHDGHTDICYRDVECTYHNIPLDGSLRLSNEMSHRLQPWDMKELRDFDVSYLSGFYADTYDVPSDTFERAVKSRSLEYINSELFRTISSASCVETDMGRVANFKEYDTLEDYDLKDVSYALLPAYFVNIQYKSGTVLVIVNGQTGKVIGALPTEKDKIVKNYIKNAIICCAIYVAMCIFFFSFPLASFVLFLPALYAIVCVPIGIKKYKDYKDEQLKLMSKNMLAYSRRKEDM